MKQKINVVFNNSKLELTKDMETVLNRGLNCTILPLRLDITQVLVNIRRHERTRVWKEVWHGKNYEGTYLPPIFKQKKNYFPQKNMQHQEDFRTT